MKESKIIGRLSAGIPSLLAVPKDRSISEVPDMIGQIASAKKESDVMIVNIPGRREDLVYFHYGPVVLGREFRLRLFSEEFPGYTTWNEYAISSVIPGFNKIPGPQEVDVVFHGRGLGYHEFVRAGQYNYNPFKNTMFCSSNGVNALRLMPEGTVKQITCVPDSESAKITGEQVCPYVSSRSGALQCKYKCDFYFYIVVDGRMYGPFKLSTGSKNATNEIIGAINAVGPDAVPNTIFRLYIEMRLYGELRYPVICVGETKRFDDGVLAESEGMDRSSVIVDDEHIASYLSEFMPQKAHAMLHEDNMMLSDRRLFVLAKTFRLLLRMLPRGDEAYKKSIKAYNNIKKLKNDDEKVKKLTALVHNIQNGLKNYSELDKQAAFDDN